MALNQQTAETAKISNLPGSMNGIDGKNKNDFKSLMAKYDSRMKEYGTALVKVDAAMDSKVKLQIELSHAEKDRASKKKQEKLNSEIEDAGKKLDSCKKAAAEFEGMLLDKDVSSDLMNLVEHRISKYDKIKNRITNSTMFLTLAGLVYAAYQFMVATSNPASSMLPAGITAGATALVATIGIISSKILGAMSNFQERLASRIASLSKKLGQQPT